MSFDGIIEHDAPIGTWFGVGGRAQRLARPRSVEQLVDVLHAHAGERVRVLGDGANLLVHDGGVDGLVLSLDRLRGVDYDGYDATLAPDRPRGVVATVGAGVRLPKLIVKTVRLGLEGIEVLGGIPASVGGAVVMNAGGAFGEIGSVVESVECVTTTGTRLTIPHDELDFGYRRSGLDHLVVASVELQLTHVPGAEQGRVRQRLSDVMAYKKSSQPMTDRSAGCVFKNPTIAGVRTSAGLLIDRAGCKGLACGGARVSERHANFVVVGDGASARDVIGLMRLVRERVRDAHGVTLEPEVVLWARDGVALLDEEGAAV
ncbi:MAG: UDP-N-acetylmuramate dehydrogenase [Planctomycetota bacterium]